MEHQLCNPCWACFDYTTAIPSDRFTRALRSNKPRAEGDAPPRKKIDGGGCFELELFAVVLVQAPSRRYRCCICRCCCWSSVWLCRTSPAVRSRPVGYSEGLAGHLRGLEGTVSKAASAAG